MNHARLAHELATALLAGPWQREALIERARKTFGRRLKSIDKVVEQVLDVMGGAPPPALKRLEHFLRMSDEFHLACVRNRLKIVKHILLPAPMSPKPGAPSSWQVPPLLTDEDVCQWLNISLEHLHWLADVHGRERARTGRLRQYVYRWIPKRSGGWRLLEMPKSKLKEIQRRVLRDLLEKIPVHPNAHGFVKNRSIRNFVSPHVRRALVIRMDLKDFFMSIQASRVHAIFRTVGYSESIARLLTGLCTNSVPSVAMRLPSRTERLSGSSQAALRTPHLPQGAPTSPALANLCAYRFDARLSALSKRFGWAYSRYADDLLFSGPHASAAFLQQFQVWVGAIAIEENLNLNFRKTRLMSSARRQQAAGMVINQKPNIAREDFDRLKAILYNCVKHGPAAQNRENHTDFRAHLFGRVMHAAHIHPARGARLRGLFDRIEWT